MTGLSTYFHPDEVMLKLAGLITDGLKYHAAAMHLISADDQIDNVAYGEAIIDAENAVKCSKTMVATAFRDNKVDVTPKRREFHTQQMTLNVSYKKMRRQFRKEFARITDVPVLKPSANSNQGKGKKTANGEEPILQVEARPPTVGNVASMEGWREILRKRA